MCEPGRSKSDIALQVQFFRTYLPHRVSDVWSANGRVPRGQGTATFTTIYIDGVCYIGEQAEKILNCPHLWAWYEGVRIIQVSVRHNGHYIKDQLSINNGHLKSCGTLISSLPDLADGDVIERFVSVCSRWLGYDGEYLYE